MTQFGELKSGDRRLEIGETEDVQQSPISNLQSLITNLQSLTLALIPLLYIATLARTLVLGDPTEYTLVANVLGIAHPPGYAFITLLGKLFQTLIPVGAIPWRMHLLSAASATLAAFFGYGIVRAVWRSTIVGRAGVLAALFGAFVLATGTDVWQHAIHANPHVITGAFLMANLYFLTRWWEENRGEDSGRVPAGCRRSIFRRGSDRWLYVFSFSAGLGVTHHPLTVFGFPAYALFIIAVRPRILREGRTLLKMVLLALLGLSVWLYYPIRSAMEPVFGPHNMDTLQGFLDHVLARGLTETLPFFSLGEQWMRALVFWSLLRLQYTLPTIALILLALGWLLRGAPEQRKLLLLYGLTFLSNYAFVINLRAQDIMAYSLGIFMLLGTLSGVGLLALLELLRARMRREPRVAAVLLALFVVMGPVFQVARNLPRISLRDYDEGQAYVESVFDYFEGSGEGAVLLHDWEHMTPMWYEQLVVGRWPDPQDVRPEFVSTQRPWVESVFAYLPGGPVYLNSYRAEIVRAGFRLRPRGPFYQVVEPGEMSAPPELTTVSDQAEAQAGEIEIVGYEAPDGPVTAGDYVPLTLAMSAPVTPTHYYVPSLLLEGAERSVEYTFTTDNHLLTPLWQPDEVIVERFDLALPHDLPGGEYELKLRVKDLSEDRLTSLQLSLGELEVQARPIALDTEGLLANFRQRVGLDGVVAWNGLQVRRGTWHENPLQVEPGEKVNLLLQWRSLALAEESYTVFVHLIDAANQPLVALDYTPLGGAAPTHLWIPKWLPGQRYLDPYRLPIPDDLPPGTYYVEVGLYEMTGSRRLHVADVEGNLVGDRVILGAVEVED